MCVFVNAWPNKKIIGYGLREQLADLLPAVLLSAVMGCAVFAVGFIPFSLVITSTFWCYVTKLISGLIVGLAVYVFISKLFKVESFAYICDTAKGFFAKKRKKKASK